MNCGKTRRSGANNNPAGFGSCSFALIRGTIVICGFICANLRRKEDAFG
jgi:hypothetical protein